MASPSTELDEQIERLRKGGTLSENEVKALCEKVSLFQFHRAKASLGLPSVIFRRIDQHNVTIMFYIRRFCHSSCWRLIEGAQFPKDQSETCQWIKSDRRTSSHQCRFCFLLLFLIKSCSGQGNLARRIECTACSCSSYCLWRYPWPIL